MYVIWNFVIDVEIVMDMYFVDDVFYFGYFFGVWVGWEVVCEFLYWIGWVVLGGVFDGILFVCFDFD